MTECTTGDSRPRSWFTASRAPPAVPRRPVRAAHPTCPAGGCRRLALTHTPNAASTARPPIAHGRHHRVRRDQCVEGDDTGDDEERDEVAEVAVRDVAEQEHRHAAHRRADRDDAERGGCTAPREAPRPRRLRARRARAWRPARANVRDVVEHHVADDRRVAGEVDEREPAREPEPPRPEVGDQRGRRELRPEEARVVAQKLLARGIEHGAHLVTERDREQRAEAHPVAERVDRERGSRSPRRRPTRAGASGT